MTQGVSHQDQAQTYISLDLETTGLSPDSDRIIEVAAVKFRGPEVVDVFSTLVNPHCPLPYRIQRLCGIEQQEVDRAPDLAAVAAGLMGFLGYHPVVGHNVGFDLGFLRQQGLTLTNLTYDTLDLAAILLPSILDHTLAGVARHLGLPAQGSHRALADALTAREVFLALRDRASRLEPQLLADLARLTARPGWGVGHLFHDLWEGQGGTGDAASILGNLKSPTQPQPLKPAARRRPPDLEALSTQLEPGGMLSRALPGYEHRPEQVQMMRAVAQALDDGQHLIVEAGTGIGKSLAYLLPTALTAAQNGHPVVISTNTISLQEQLIGKDIPDLLGALAGEGEALPRDLRAVQVKGRANYLCLRRWAALASGKGLSLDEMRLLARLRLWLEGTETGDRAELNLSPAEVALWPRLSAQTEECLGERCPYRQGHCFLHRARQAAQSAHLVVVNHSLLLSDLVTGARILPDYRHLVVDEAHHLEAEATRQLGYRLAPWDVMEHLEATSQSPGQRHPDVLSLVRELLLPTAPPGRRRKPEPQMQAVVRQVEQARPQVFTFFGLAQEFFEQHAKERGEYDRHLRLTPALRAQPGWSGIEIAWENLSLTLSEVASALEALYLGLEDLAKPENPDQQGVLLELTSLLHTNQELRHQIGCVVSSPEASTIYWLSFSGRSGVLSLCAAPLDVAPFLSAGLFQARESVILTGATLSTEGTFEYLKGRLGLEETGELLLGSPFDYPRAALIYLPYDLPEPGRPEYQPALEQALIQLCRATGGRTLVLFTSHSSLKAAHSAIRGPLEQQDILVLGQGIDGSPKQLLAVFRENPRTVALGTASFWEGIDVVGEALSVLVMARLPFNVPTEPLFAARAETFDDPFNQYALPQAILRFRQGFGRLIRSRNDRGALVLLDSRLQTKGYGGAFLDSLPRCTVVRGSARDMAATVVGWLEG